MRRGTDDAGRLVLLQLLFCILVMLPTLSYSGSQLPIFSPASPPSSLTSLPTFLPSPTRIQVSPGEVASLQCHLGGLAPHHTVSWLRSQDVSVLTVGGLVFSSDPRIAVVSHSRPVASQGDWTLTIQNCQTQDTGSYRCQVNTEPSSSKTFTLEVVEKSKEVEEEDEEENSVVKVQNDQKTSDESESSVQSLSIVSVRLGAGGREEGRFHFSKVELGEGERAGELEEEEDSEDGAASSPPVAVSPVHTPRSPSLGPWGSSLGPPSLAAPVLSLLSLTLLVIGLGALRGFYTRCRGGQATEQIRTKPSRPRVSSMDSSRRSALRRQRRDDRDEENLYEQCRLPQSRPLSPLIEVTEPTPSLAHPSLFSLTTEQDTSLDSSDYSNTSEVTSSLSAPSYSLPAAPLPSPASNNSYSSMGQNRREDQQIQVLPVGSLLCGSVRVSVQREKHLGQGQEYTPGGRGQEYMPGGRGQAYMPGGRGQEQEQGLRH